MEVSIEYYVLCLHRLDYTFVAYNNYELSNILHMRAIRRTERR